MTDEDGQAWGKYMHAREAVQAITPLIRRSRLALTMMQPRSEAVSFWSHFLEFHVQYLLRDISPLPLLFHSSTPPLPYSIDFTLFVIITPSSCRRRRISRPGLRQEDGAGFLKGGVPPRISRIGRWAKCGMTFTRCTKQFYWQFHDSWKPHTYWQLVFDHINQSQSHESLLCIVVCHTLVLLRKRSAWRRSCRQGAHLDSAVMATHLA